jgi:hypothetical protein
MGRCPRCVPTVPEGGQALNAEPSGLEENALGNQSTSLRRVTWRVLPVHSSSYDDVIGGYYRALVLLLSCMLGCGETRIIRCATGRLDLASPRTRGPWRTLFNPMPWHS